MAQKKNLTIYDIDEVLHKHKMHYMVDGCEACEEDFVCNFDQDEVSDCKGVIHIHYDHVEKKFFISRCSVNVFATITERDNKVIDVTAIWDELKKVKQDLVELGVYTYE